MDAGSLHTIMMLVEQYHLSERQVALLRQRLHGKAVHLDDEGSAWFRWCDIRKALDDDEETPKRQPVEPQAVNR